MKKLVLLILLLSPVLCFSQKDDWNWWNELHGWKTGMASWRTFLTLTPKYLGPNALPVPEIKKGLVNTEKKIEIGSDFHFKNGDNTPDIFGNFYYPFLDGKIAVEAYGVIVEYYNMTDSVRDERVARDKDGTGIAFGDLYFSTLVQIIKDKKFPDTMLRMACKTASGGRLDAARYSDSPGYFLDLSFSKCMSAETRTTKFTPFASLGFYSWQTNDDMNLQDDALLYGTGLDISTKGLTITNSLGGYFGYKNNGDRPAVYTFDLQKKMKHNTLRLQYLYGLHDWTYRTIRLSFIWKLN